MDATGYITDRDLVAARGLLRWSQKDLGEKAIVGVATIRRFETGGTISEDRQDALVAALVKAGIVFFGHMEIEGIAVARGVALRPTAKPKRQRRLVYPRGGTKETALPQT